MLFNSITFAIFFVIVFALYWPLRRWHRAQNVLLLIASYFFYGWWDKRFLVLIIISTVVDYCCALSIDKGRMALRKRLAASAYVLAGALLFLGLDLGAIRIGLSGHLPKPVVAWGQLVSHNPKYWYAVLGVATATLLFNGVYPALLNLKESTRRKLFLIFSVVANLTILGFFKYFNFFADSIATLAQGTLGVTPGRWFLDVVLPIGISFYTFQTMSYTIDVYRRDAKASGALLDVATYVAFFPQLVAGPIERGKHLLPQFQRSRSLGPGDVREGLWLLTWGLYKKMVVADNMAKIVNSTFGPFDNLTSAVAVPEDGMRLLVAIYAFALQIYCDFSGYTDIARGTAKLLGFDIMLNFNLPYFARSPSDFWRRWHISLSTWLRDYLYIPLGGNRRGTVRTYVNLLITMLLGGLWHGAAWTFVIWGGFHGGILALYRLLVPNAGRGRPSWPIRAIQIVIVFHLVCFGWLIFRAQNLRTIGVFLQSITLHPHWSAQALDSLGRLVFYGWFLVAFQVAQAWTGDLIPLRRWPWFIRLNVWAFVVMSLLALAARGGMEFIYFAF